MLVSQVGWDKNRLLDNGAEVLMFTRARGHPSSPVTRCLHSVSLHVQAQLRWCMVLVSACCPARVSIFPDSEDQNLP